MKNNFDELINKFLDNEIDSDELNTIKDLLKNNLEFRAKFTTQKYIHENLNEIPLHSAPINITELVMGKIISKLNVKIQKNYFFKGILVTLLAFLIIALYFFFSFLGDLKFVQQTVSYIDYTSNYFQPIISFLSKIFKNDIFRTLSGLFGFIILLSFYFSLNSFKDFKNRMKQF
ncbi:MAG: hypothetical protein IPH62_02600 [Ignavibacteriae bacterium]|nr:hypothetical protein [Ignavibacteriota bacterium]